MLIRMHCQCFKEFGSLVIHSYTSLLSSVLLSLVKQNCLCPCILLSPIRTGSSLSFSHLVSSRTHAKSIDNEVTCLPSAVCSPAFETVVCRWDSRLREPAWIATRELFRLHMTSAVQLTGRFWHVDCCYSSGDAYLFMSVLNIFHDWRGSLLA